MDYWQSLQERRYDEGVERERRWLDRQIEVSERDRRRLLRNFWIFVALFVATGIALALT